MLCSLLLIVCSDDIFAFQSLAVLSDVQVDLKVLFANYQIVVWSRGISEQKKAGNRGTHDFSL